MKRRLSREQWEQIKVAYAAGADLRELARNAGIPEGTVLARAKRDEWTQQIAQAKPIERPELARDLVRPDAIDAITPLQSAAITMQQRWERYAEGMAGVSERVLPHLESPPPNELLDTARNVEQDDRWCRRNFGLDSMPPAGGSLNLNILCNHSAVQIIPPS